MFCACFLGKIECCSVDTLSDEDVYIPKIHRRKRKVEVSAKCVTINQNSKKEDIGKLKTWFSYVIVCMMDRLGYLVIVCLLLTHMVEA